MSPFLLLAVAAAAIPPAAPGPSARTVERGYQARLSQDGLLCLRPTTDAEGERLDIARGREECQHRSRWADDGLRVEDGARS